MTQQMRAAEMLLGTRPSQSRWSVTLDRELLRAARQKAGLSQERLAYKSGLSRTTISKLERHPKPRCHFRTRYLIAVALGSDPLAITAATEQG